MSSAEQDDTDLIFGDRFTRFTRFTRFSHVSRVSRLVRSQAPIVATKTCNFARAQRHVMINLIIVVITAMIWQFCCFSRENDVEVGSNLISRGINPCCAFPCQYAGVCTHLPSDFDCDCMRTGHYGRTCHKPTFTKWFENMFCPTKETILLSMGKYDVFWKWVTRSPSITSLLTKFVFITQCNVIPLPPLYNIEHDFANLDAFYNRTVYRRHLPPIPRNCPAEMGINGPKTLPNVTEVYDRLFKRRKFIPCPKGTNVFFVMFTLFAHQHLYKTDYSCGIDLKVGNPDMPEDATMLYGTLGKKHNPLRSYHEGKLSMIKFDGEDYPAIDQPNGYLFLSLGLASRGPDNQPEKPLLGISGPLFVLTTLWAREHNRICDLLREEHEDWDDDKLYETARLIVIGLLTQITYSELVHHMNQDVVKINYRPEATHFTTIQHYNVYLQEFMKIFEWHMQLPDALPIDGQLYCFQDTTMNRTVVFKYGFNRFLASMFNTVAGKITTRNNADMLEHVRKEILQESRDLRIQSFNNYRRSLFLKPYRNFEEFNSDPDIVDTLRDLYGHVDAVEFYSGLFADKDFTSITPQTMRMIYNNWYTKWLMSSPLHHFNWWKPVTFGGQKFMDIISQTTLKDFICNNVHGNCEEMNIAFTTPSTRKNDLEKE